MRDRTCPEYGRAMELVGRPRPWVAGVAVVALVLLLTWVTSGPYVNLFAPFDDEEPTGGGGAAGSYERYSGLEDVARGSASGGIWLIVLGILASCAVLALLVWAVSRHGFRLPLRRRARPDGAAVASHTPTTSPDVRAERTLQVVLNELAKGDHPRNSILAAWRELEAASETAGESLAISRTPHDVTTMLAALTGDRRASEDFERIYLAARYGDAPVTEASREQAVALLTQLRSRISAPTTRSAR